MSDVLGGVSRGKKLGESALEAGSRALRQVAGAPPDQSPSGEALQNMHISNQLPIHIPPHAVNRMQPKERPRRRPVEEDDEEGDSLEEELPRKKRPARDDSTFARMQPRVRIVERESQRAPRGALAAPGGFVSHRDAPRRAPAGMMFVEDAEEEDDTVYEPPPRARRAAPRRVSIEEIDIPVRRPRARAMREAPRSRVVVQEEKIRKTTGAGHKPARRYARILS